MLKRELQLSADELTRALLRLDESRRVQMLDSCGARGRGSRFLIAGFDPFETIEAHGPVLSRFDRDGRNDLRLDSTDVLSVLDERLARYRVRKASDSEAPASGACIATFSYELAHSFEPLRSRLRSVETGDEPDAVLSFYDTLVIHDYARGLTEVVSVNDDARRLAQVLELLQAASAEGSHIMSQTSMPATLFESTADSNFTREQYIAAVERIKEHIAAGDIYQANLTQQLTVALDSRLTAEKIFLALRRDHPASFAAFIRRRDDAVVSASPERFLRARAGHSGERTVEAWPIKGTRPRGATPEEDERLRAELRRSEKDRAENVMIVDLVRNDLGRVCHYGSVSVPELFIIEEHPTLFHLVSKVRGSLRPKVSAGDLVRAAFPCGSITGAPKIRAMQIINEIETRPRGLSMGAIGYFSFDGSLDLSVAIRTMVVRDGVARFNVGGGVVADSEPNLEYEESLVKARALLKATGVRPAKQ